MLAQAFLRECGPGYFQLEFRCDREVSRNFISGNDRPAAAVTAWGFEVTCAILPVISQILEAPDFGGSQCYGLSRILNYSSRYYWEA